MKINSQECKRTMLQLLFGFIKLLLFFWWCYRFGFVNLKMLPTFPQLDQFLVCKPPTIAKHFPWLPSRHSEIQFWAQLNRTQHSQKCFFEFLPHLVVQVESQKHNAQILDLLVFRHYSEYGSLSFSQIHLFPSLIPTFDPRVSHHVSIFLNFPQILVLVNSIKYLIWIG